MKINNLTIVPPEGMEAYQEGDEIKFRPVNEKLTYEDIAEKLFKDKIVSIIDNHNNNGIITKIVKSNYNYSVCCTSEKQAKKLLAINKLMNVAKYLNNGWKPDWSDSNETKYHLVISKEEIKINYVYSISIYNIYFRTKDLAERAIQILGEYTIKLALCTDY